MQIPKRVWLVLKGTEDLTLFQSFLEDSGVIIDEKSELMISDCLDCILEGIQKGKKVISVNLYLDRQIMEQCALMVPDLNSLMILWSEKELILFDMDGLLVDTELMCLEPFRKAHQKYGYMISDEILYKLIGTSGVVLERILKENYDEQYPFEKIIQSADEYMIEEVKKNLPVKSGAHELLEYYHQLNIPCIVASSSPKETIDLYIRQAEFTGMFQNIVCLNDVHRSKPEPDIFLKGLEKMHTSAQNSLVFEDSKNGIIAAKRAGIPVVCVPDLLYHSEEIFRFTIGFAKDLNHFIQI